MTSWDIVKKHLAEKANLILGSEAVTVSDFSYPTRPDFGDLSLPCFSLAKKNNQNPGQLAGSLVSGFGQDDWVLGVRAVGPYLNFTLNKKKIAESLWQELQDQGEKYGHGSAGQKKRVMVEFSNVNTHKEYHIGHLRNLCYGDAVARLLRANDYETLAVSYINDFGIHTAKTLWTYLEFYKGKEPIPDNKGYFLGKIYARSSQEIEKNPAGKDLVSFMMKKIESREGEEYRLWEETRQWSIEQFAKIYQELGVKFDQTFYESEFIDEGKKKVEELARSGVLKMSDGAIIADLEEWGLGVLVIIRSDGTALYPVADLPLGIHKIEKYGLDESIYVVDIRQSLYFKQLFKIFELMGYKQKMIHLGYDFVKLPSGMMSSRSGNTVTYEDLRQEILSRSTTETAQKHPDWPKEKVWEVAEKIMIGAIKFEMLKVGADQIIVFDADKALRFDGFTSAYLQYTGARLASIQRKSGLEIEALEKADFGQLKDEKEKTLILFLARYAEVIARAGENYNPSELAKYLFELAQMANDYYHSVPVLRTDVEEEAKLARLALLHLAGATLRGGLELLGIDYLAEM